MKRYSWNHSCKIIIPFNAENWQFKDQFILSTVYSILSDKSSDPSSSRETGTFSQKYLHSVYHHRHHVILMVVLVLSLLLNLVFISVYFCKKFCRSSTLNTLSQKKTTIVDNLIQGKLKHSESKQRLVWVSIVFFNIIVAEEQVNHLSKKLIVPESMYILYVMKWLTISILRL